MVVPGVSGSHLMLLMGNYELIVTKGIPWLTKASTFVDGARIIVPFVLGALVSIVMFSHLLAWLMREYRDSTLSVLAGFMLGSLPVVYPWKVPGESTYLFSLPSWNNELLLAVVMAGLGFATVFILELLARHSKKKQQQRLENPKPKKQRKHKRQKKQKRHGRKTKKN